MIRCEYPREDLHQSKTVTTKSVSEKIFSKQFYL